MPPASTMPWMEFAADISGVCSVAGTLLMTSKPTHRLNTKMMKSVRSMNGSSRSSVSSGWIRRFGESGVNHLAAVGDDDTGDELVIEIHGELAVADHVGQQ